MTRRRRTDVRARERLLFKYSAALDRGDFAAVAAILRQAEHDPLLAKMIEELDAAYQTELAAAGFVLNTNHRERKELPMIAVSRPPFDRMSARPAQHSLLTAAVLLVTLVILGSAVALLRPQTSLELLPPPVDPHAAAGASVPDLQAQIGQTNCQVTTGSNGALLYTAPQRDAQVSAQLPADTVVTVEVQSVVIESGRTWVLLRAALPSGAVQGWLDIDDIPSRQVVCAPSTVMGDLAFPTPTVTEIRTLPVTATPAALIVEVLPTIAPDPNTVRNLFAACTVETEIELHALPDLASPIEQTLDGVFTIELRLIVFAEGGYWALVRVNTSDQVFEGWIDGETLAVLAANCAAQTPSPSPLDNVQSLIPTIAAPAPPSIVLPTIVLPSVVLPSGSQPLPPTATLVPTWTPTPSPRALQPRP